MATDIHSVSDLPTSARERTWAEMQRIAATAQRNIESRGLPAHEFEALVDDVCREIRHGHDA